jgi:hypothetical protein
VVAVNTQIAFYKKSTGQKTFQQDYANFLNGNAAHVISDPKVFFDHLTNRWFTLIIDADLGGGKTSTMLIGVSDSEDPNQGWKKYAVDSELKVGSDEFWLDYPGFGVNKDTVVFTGNMFGYTSGYAGNAFTVIPKKALLSGTAFTAKQFQDADAGTVKVAINADPLSDKVYCVSFDNTTQLKLHAILNGATAPSIVSTKVTIPTAIYPSTQLVGPGGQMDGFGDARLFTANYRGGKLVTAHSLQVSGTDTRQMVRWYQLTMNNWPSGSDLPTLSNVGNVIGGAGENFHMPAANINARGDIALGFTKTTSTTSAEHLVTAHKKTDKFGVMSKPIVVGKSTGAYVGYRWGDYFAVSIDPTDSKTFWTYGMLGRSDGYWNTIVSNFKVSVAGDNAVGYAPTSATITDGKLTAGTLASLASVDGSTYNITSAPLKGVGQVSGVEAVYTTPVRPLTTDYVAINATVNAPAASTVFTYIWNNTTGKYQLAGSQPGSTTNIKFAFVDTAAGTYVNATGQIKVLVRVVLPVRGGMPVAYTLKLDQLQALAGLKTD